MNKIIRKRTQFLIGFIFCLCVGISTNFANVNNVVKDLSTKGYLAVSVPGTVKGLNYALEKYGTMSRKRAIAPAIKLASQGYTLQQGDVDI
jgi:gamma-glutamyltranspeptidase